MDLSISAKAGGVATISIAFDIGSDQSTVTIPIIERDQSVGKTPPFNISTTNTIFSLETFKNNGGKIFIKTDTGTVTVNTCAITIQRVSSGAISSTL